MPPAWPILVLRCLRTQACPPRGTFRGQLYVIRLVSPEPQILLLVILDRDRVNLAMARHQIRTFCASFAA